MLLTCRVAMGMVELSRAVVNLVLFLFFLLFKVMRFMGDESLAGSSEFAIGNYIVQKVREESASCDLTCISTNVTTKPLLCNYIGI